LNFSLCPHPLSLCCHNLHASSGLKAAFTGLLQWAEVLSADAFSAFEEVGLENEEVVSLFKFAYPFQLILLLHRKVLEEISLIGLAMHFICGWMLHPAGE